MKTDRSYLVDILKERYDYEQFRRNNYDNLINLPITILALLVGGLAAIATQGETLSDVIKYSVLASMVPISVSIYYLVRVFYGASRNYDVLPQAHDINEHYERLIQYHTELNQPSEQVHLSFQDDLIKWYSDCSKVNCEVNDKRMSYFQKSKLWLIISIVVIFVLLVSKVHFQM
jgi:small-conductance mechanosensitive channel